MSTVKKKSEKKKTKSVKKNGSGNGESRYDEVKSNVDEAKSQVEDVTVKDEVQDDMPAEAEQLMDEILPEA